MRASEEAVSVRTGSQWRRTRYGHRGELLTITKGTADRYGTVEGYKGAARNDVVRMYAWELLMRYSPLTPPPEAS